MYILYIYIYVHTVYIYIYVHTVYIYIPYNPYGVIPYAPPKYSNHAVLYMAYTQQDEACDVKAFFNPSN